MRTQRRSNVDNQHVGTAHTKIDRNENERTNRPSTERIDRRQTISIDRKENMSSIELNRIHHQPGQTDICYNDDGRFFSLSCAWQTEIESCFRHCSEFSCFVTCGQDGDVHWFDCSTDQVEHIRCADQCYSAVIHVRTIQWLNIGNDDVSSLMKGIEFVRGHQPSRTRGSLVADGRQLAEFSSSQSIGLRSISLEEEADRRNEVRRVELCATDSILSLSETFKFWWSTWPTIKDKSNISTNIRRLFFRWMSITKETIWSVRHATVSYGYSAWRIKNWSSLCRWSISRMISSNDRSCNGPSVDCCLVGLERPNRWWKLTGMS